MENYKLCSFVPVKTIKFATLKDLKEELNKLPSTFDGAVFGGDLNQSMFNPMKAELIIMYPSNQPIVEESIDPREYMEFEIDILDEPIDSL